MNTSIRNIALCLCAVLFLQACASGRKPAPTPPPPAEPVHPGKEIGRQFLLEARKQYRFVTDQDVNNAVKNMGRRIVLAAGQNPDDYQFFVVEQIQPNAFAIPGGYIFIFDGLLARMETEDELAGVLAHEVAHVVHNHFFKDAPAVTALGMATIAAILLSRGSGAATSIAMATNIAAQLKFSRTHEEEADRSAVKYLERSGYGTDGLAKFLSRLSEYEDIHGYDFPPYLSTHPILQERIHMAELRSERTPTSAGPVTSPVIGDWERVRVKVRGRLKPESPAEWVVGKKVLEESDAGRKSYLTGLAHLSAGRTAEAATDFLNAVEEDPQNPFYRGELAWTYLKGRKAEAARREAEKSLELSGGGPEPEAALLVMGMIGINEGNYKEAGDSLERLVRTNPGHSMGHYQLGQAYYKTGESL
ncbi:MAG TPA: M48 family metalloprotease, partial [Nitrospiria bacterium]|nr:M48 family metalloprotease [Nitrospiria bacterium]